MRFWLKKQKEGLQDARWYPLVVSRREGTKNQGTFQKKHQTIFVLVEL